MVSPKFSTIPSFKKRLGGKSFFPTTPTYLVGLFLLLGLMTPLNDLLATNTAVSNNCETESSMLAGEEFVAILSGMQEVCPKITSASGKVTAVVHGNTLQVSGYFSNLEGQYAASHIHFGIVGRNGPVVFALKPTITANKKNGTFLAAHNTFQLQGEQAWDLKNRRLYINVHSTKVPSGELRGQLLPPAQRYFHTNLLGKNEVPSNGSNAQGQIVFEMQDGYLTASGSFDDFSSEVAVNILGGGHIHRGFSGQNGGVAIVLNLTLDTDKKGGQILADNNRFHLTHAQKKYLAKEELYVNIHSTANRGGEIRGQISSIIKGASFEGKLSGGQEVPIVPTPATGSIFVNYDGSRHIRLSGSYNSLSSEAVAAHIHLGKRGQNGPVQKVLTLINDATGKSGVFDPRHNRFELDRKQIKALFRNELYVNLHTKGHPSGELRAQLIPLTLAKCGASFNRVDITEEMPLETDEPLMIAQNGTVHPSTSNTFGINTTTQAPVSPTLTIYPNPANSQFTLEYDSRKAEVQMTIFHVSGKILLQQNLPASANQHLIDVQHLPAGLYLVSLQAPGKLPVTKRLVKQGNR